jgi:hypothetical protein
MSEDTTQNPNIFSGLVDYFSKTANTAKNAIIGNQQQITSNNGNDPSYTGAGGARSRRRKCNKKHRHTKSCRKYVKKGRKTRKH